MCGSNVRQVLHTTVPFGSTRVRQLSLQVWGLVSQSFEMSLKMWNFLGKKSAHKEESPLFWEKGRRERREGIQRAELIRCDVTNNIDFRSARSLSYWHLCSTYHHILYRHILKGKHLLMGNSQREKRGRKITASVCCYGLYYLPLLEQGTLQRWNIFTPNRNLGWNVKALFNQLH